MTGTFIKCLYEMYNIYFWDGRLEQDNLTTLGNRRTTITWNSVKMSVAL